MNSKAISDFAAGYTLALLVMLLLLEGHQSLSRMRLHLHEHGSVLLSAVQVVMAARAAKRAAAAV